jgi:uncharacterized membrane protein
VDISTAEVVLFAASVVSAALAAFRNDILPKVEKLALAVAFAATAFLLSVQSVWK